VRQVLPDHSQLVALIESQMPQLSDGEFTALMDTARENKMAHSKLPTLEEARQLIFGYLKRNELDAAWVTYLDFKATLKGQQQVIYNDKLVYDALLVYYGLHQKFNYADTIYQDMKKASIFDTSNMHRTFVPDHTTLNALLLAYHESGLIAQCLEVYECLYTHHLLPSRANQLAVLKCAALAGDAKTLVRFYSRLEHKGARMSRASLRHVLSAGVWSKKVNAHTVEERVHQLSAHDEKYWGVLSRLAVRVHNWQLVSDTMALVDKFAKPPTPAVTILETPLKQLVAELAWVPPATALRDRAQALVDRLARLHSRVNARALATDVRNFYAELPAELTKLGYNPSHVIVPSEQRKVVREVRIKHVSRRESMAQYLPAEELQRRKEKRRFVTPQFSETTLNESPQSLFRFAPQYLKRKTSEARQTQLKAEQDKLQRLHQDVNSELQK
jgi:hypothetical protein